MRKRLNVSGAQRLSARNGNGILRSGDIAPHMLELHECHAQIRRIYSLNGNRTAKQRTRRQECARFNTVAHRSVLTRVHLGESDTLYRDGRRTRTLHMSAHGIQHIGKVDDFGFTRSIINN